MLAKTALAPLVTNVSNVFNIMFCGFCCKEFKGWCHSFTRTERALTVLESLLLVILIVFLIFLISHLLACSSEYVSKEKNPDDKKPDYAVNISTTLLPTTIVGRTKEGFKTPTLPAEISSTDKYKTIDPNVECSWTPSAKTTSLTRYFDISASPLKIDPITTPTNPSSTTKLRTYSTSEYEVDFIEEDQSDGEEAEPELNEYVRSLVKRTPPQRVVFGCILTIISKFFMLTSASCIEAIEEVDSLDSFVIMEGYGTSSDGRTQAVADVRVHPFYRGVDRGYDVALLRGAGDGAGRALLLPEPLDAALLTIGERFHILGFGPYRSSDSRSGRRLRRAGVVLLPRAQCSAPALRHLEAGRARGGGAGGAGRCAGPLSARGLACQYCGGAPLLRGRRLLALMADNPHCGLRCEPQLYVDIADCTDWIDSVINEK